MQERPRSPLEARVNISGADDACCNCNLHGQRIQGGTETFVAGRRALARG